MTKLDGKDRYKQLKRQCKVLEKELMTMEKCSLTVKQQKYLDSKTKLRLILKEMNELVMSVSNYEFYNFW